MGFGYDVMIFTYEPLTYASIAHLTRKKVFLVALASGRRRSELHALSADLQFFYPGYNRSDVTFLADPLFWLRIKEPTWLPCLLSF